MSLKSLKKVQIFFCQTTVILFKKIFIDNCISNSNKYKNCAIEDQTIGNLLESIGNLGSKIWNLVPVHMKDLKAPNTFKNQIKKQIPKDCPCHLCKSICSTGWFLQKLLRLFASFSGIQYCLFYPVFFILFYFIYFFFRFIVLLCIFISIHVFIHFINLFIY